MSDPFESIDGWAAAIDEGLRPTEIELSVAMAKEPAATNGGSRAFPCVATDSNRYWVKVLNNGQDRRVPLNELVVSGFGGLIGAPVTIVRAITVPSDLDGCQVPNGPVLQAGIASASLDLRDSTQIGALDQRSRDDNRRRHAGCFAIFDLCYGSSDLQWLRVETDDGSTHSHDHGHYFPQGPPWTAAGLLAAIDEPHPLPQPTDDLDPHELVRLAESLESITPPSILRIVHSIPASWDIPTEDLAALGFFVFRRTRPVAARLRALSGE